MARFSWPSQQLSMQLGVHGRLEVESQDTGVHLKCIIVNQLCIRVIHTSLQLAGTRILLFPAHKSFDPSHEIEGILFVSFKIIML